MAAPTKEGPAAANEHETFLDSPLLPANEYKLPGPPPLDLKTPLQLSSDAPAPSIYRDEPQQSVEHDEATADLAPPATVKKPADQPSPVLEDDALWEGRTSREDSFTSSTPTLTT